MSRIGVIVGSNASKSINRIVASTFPSLAPEGVEFVNIDLTALPIYSYDLDSDFPAEALEWKAAIESVDGVIIVTPEYSRSIPGVLKNALDWASRPYGTNAFNNKPVAIMGASWGGVGTAAAQQHLRAILAHFNAVTMGQPETFLQFKPAAFGPEGEIVDDATRAIVEGFVAAASAHVERHQHAAVAA
jgi:chromate reductase